MILSRLFVSILARRRRPSAHPASPCAEVRVISALKGRVLPSLLAAARRGEFSRLAQTAADADETASERADRKSARERRRRAEVGEKFEELTKALGEAEERCAGSVPRRDAVSEGNRVDLLQRAIDVVRALTKACVDAKRAAAAAPAPAPPRAND